MLLIISTSAKIDLKNASTPTLTQIQSVSSSLNSTINTALIKMYFFSFKTRLCNALMNNCYLCKIIIKIIKKKF